jgi:hypothetical protein
VFALVLSGLPRAGLADVAVISAAAERHFARMPQVEIVSKIAGTCGADRLVNPDIAYCTSENRIILARAAAGSPTIGYKLAHLYGHAVQVRHGVATVALATIRARPKEEAALRADVTRQVECIAGVIHARSGLPPLSLMVLFREEPMTGSHWGRAPLRRGPRVSIGLSERDAWFQKGQEAGHPRVCSTVSFPADLVVRAFRQ